MRPAAAIIPFPARRAIVGVRALQATTPVELGGHDFAGGSMAPKVAAVCSFVQATGKRAVIGSLDRIEDLLAGSAGTQVTPA